MDLDYLINFFRYLRIFKTYLFEYEKYENYYTRTTNILLSADKICILVQKEKIIKHLFHPGVY